MTDDTPAPAPDDDAKNIGVTFRDPSLAWPLDELAGWSNVDVRAVDTARVLAPDAA